MMTPKIRSLVAIAATTAVTLLDAEYDRPVDCALFSERCPGQPGATRRGEERSARRIFEP